MKNFAFLIVLCLAIVGCKPSYPSASSYKEVTAGEIYDFITYTNKISPLGDRTIMTDALYAVPTVSWIKNEYAKELGNFLFKYQLRTPSEIDNDCDNYVSYGLTVGHIMHHFAKNKPTGTALAIGEFAYVPSLDGHAVNFFIAMDEFGKLKVVFFEPQSQQIFDLDVQEVPVLYWKM